MWLKTQYIVLRAPKRAKKGLFTKALQTEAFLKNPEKGLFWPFLASWTTTQQDSSESFCVACGVVEK